MKRGFSTSVAIVAAFLTGMSIYVACGKTDINGDISTAELKAEIQLLKNELDVLSAKVGEFKVDDLYFDRSGWVSSKLLKRTYEDDPFIDTYYYDESGRLIKWVSESDTDATTREYSYYNDYRGREGWRSRNNGILLNWRRCAVGLSYTV